MIYLKKNEETQIVNIPKNGDYKGKLSYEEGFVAGYTDGLNDGRENPYSTKGFFFENGEKEFIYPVKIDRNTMLQISFLGGNTSDYAEISFYPMGNGCVLANQNDSFIVCAMRGDLLRVFIYNNLQFELPCKQEEWHTLRLYTDRVILDGEETYFNTPYMDSSYICACVNRGGNGFYRGLIQYIKGVEGEAVMYYISNLDEGGFKRLRSDNGVSDWYENSFAQFWGEFPIMQAKAPLNSVFINVEGSNVCPELTVLDVDSNGRYEGAFSAVNVNVPDVNGSYDEGYNNGRNEGYDEGYNNVINNLQLLTITENGQYIPLGKYLMLDTDDGFTMGNFTSNTVFNISFSIRGFDGVEGKNEFPILGGYPNGNWQGIKVTRNGELKIKWGSSIKNIPVTTFRKYNLTLIPNPNDNEVVIMLDDNDTIFTSSMFEFETPIYLGSVLGDGAGFDFFEAKVWSNIDEFSNLNDAEYVYSPVENGILKNGNLISNRNGGYANLVTSEGFREIYVDVPQEGGSCNLGELNVEWQSNWNENNYYAYKQGYDGYSYVHIDATTALKEKYDEGYEAGKAEGGDCDYQDYRELVLRAKIEDADFIDENTFWDKSKIVEFNEYTADTADTIMFIDSDRESWRGDYVTIVQNVSGRKIMLKEGLFTNLEDIYELEITCDTIDENAFNGCANLTKLVLPYTPNINENAFKGCTNLKEIEVKHIKNIAPSAFDGCPTTGIIKVKDNRFDTSILPSTLSNWKIIYVEDNEVAGIIDVAKYGIKFVYSTFKEIPDFLDFSNVTDMSRMFESCGNLTTISKIDTSNATNMENMFYYCTNLTTIPQLDTSKVTNMSDAFSRCTALTSLPALNMQSLNMYSFAGMFGNTELPKLINLGGFLNLKLSLTSDKNLKKLPNLTYESCINVLNGLYDFTGNGETPTSEQGQLKVHQNFIDLVGDEISIATNKGWQILA
jgi:surface protein